MPKILLVTDTTSTLSPMEAQKYNIECLPLSVIIDGKEYRDHLDMSAEELAAELRKGAVPTTSQPNIGYVSDKMKEWKQENYDAIIIITISKHLSGTYQGFKFAAESNEMKNVTLFDSETVGAPIMDMVLAAKKMVDDGASVEAIVEMLEKKKKNTYSFLFPETLEQLKKGGRISPVAAGMASLLKIKALLYLADHGVTIEKYGMVRTESKLFEMMISEFRNQKVETATHRFYIMEADGIEVAKRFGEKLKESFEGIEISYVQLPAVLTSHAGLGSMAVQSCIKD